jgi:uncharacterized membrane protein YeiH
MELQLALDLMGTFVFALSDTLAGVKRELDLFGVLVLSFAAGNAGGIIRDVVIASEPRTGADLRRSGERTRPPAQGSGASRRGGLTAR